jgi:hypothetical protein
MFRITVKSSNKDYYGCTCHSNGGVKTAATDELIEL